MKNLFNTFFFLVLGLVLVGGLGCEGCKEPDPCEEEDVHPVTADFTIMEDLNFITSFDEDNFIPFDTDTLVRNNAIFTALEENAEYTWIIGAETLHVKSFERHSFPLGATIPITLIVKKEPNLLCFPDDDGIDTLTRYLYKTDTSYQHKAYGDFIGYNENYPQDTFTLKIRGELLFNHFYLRIFNLKGSCDFNTTNYIEGYKQISFSHGACDQPRGQILILENDKEIKVTYTFDLGENSGKKYVFRGKRK